MIERQDCDRAVEPERDVFELHGLPLDMALLMPRRGISNSRPYLILSRACPWSAAESPARGRQNKNTQGNPDEHFRSHQTRRRRDRRNGGIGLGIAQALAAAGCSVSIWGRNADKNARAAATMAAGPARSMPDLRRHRRRFGQSGNDRHAREIRPVDGCFANAASAAAGAMPSSIAPRSSGAACSRPISTRVSRVPGRRPPHDERATAGDAFGGWSQPPASLAVRHRPQRALRRDQGRHQRAGARWRSSWRSSVTANAILPGWIKSEIPPA